MQMSISWYSFSQTTSIIVENNDTLVCFHESEARILAKDITQLQHTQELVTLKNKSLDILQKQIDLYSKKADGLNDQVNLYKHREANFSQQLALHKKQLDSAESAIKRSRRQARLGTFGLAIGGASLLTTTLLLLSQ